MSQKVKITIKNLQKKIPVSPKGIKKIILEVFSAEKIKRPVELTVCFVTDRKIKELNRRFLGKDEPTDVLAFDMQEDNNAKNISADIVISTDTALRNAGVFRTSVSKELNLYLIHGLLHLLGYDDHRRFDKKKMRDKEREYADR